MGAKPIKRHSALQPLSREHHFGLLFCWKIREGFKRNIAIERIKNFADWFWNSHLKKHFETEERLLFPVLPSGDTGVKKAIAEHRRLKRLFEDESNLQKSLSLLEEELEQHIRFEERVLFNEIQLAATEEQMKDIEDFHNKPFDDNWSDEFWKEK